MRLALVILVAGCIKAPTGMPQSWPPEGVMIERVIAGDVDGGQQDLIVLGIGDEASTGMYFLRGGDDINGAGALAKFTKFVPLELSMPATGIVSSTSSARVVLAYSRKGDLLPITLDAFNAQLADAVDPSGGDRFAASQELWMHETAGHFIYSNGAIVISVALSGVDVLEIEPPSAVWPIAEVATLFDDQVAVATGTEIKRAKLPAGNAAFSWIDVRLGRTWTSQIAFDLDGDGRESIIGYDRTSNLVCARDPLGFMDTCFPVPPGNPTPVALLAGQLGGTTAADIALVHLDPTETTIDFTLDAFTVSPMRVTQSLPAAFSHAVLLQLPSGPTAALLVDATGHSACVAPTGPC